MEKLTLLSDSEIASLSKQKLVTLVKECKQIRNSEPPQPAITLEFIKAVMDEKIDSVVSIFNGNFEKLTQDFTQRIESIEEDNSRLQRDIEELKENKQSTETLLRNLRNDLNILQAKTQTNTTTPLHTQNLRPLHFQLNPHSPTNEATVLRALNQEKEDQEAKRKNVVIKGLTIPSTSSNDLNTVTEIISDLNCNIGSISPTIKRTGKNNDLLIVTLTEEKSSYLIRNAKNLRNFEKWSNVFLNPDLTRAQSETQYLLRQALKEKKKSEPDKTWIIKNNKIQAKKSPTHTIENSSTT